MRIERHKTAIKRIDFSRPVRLALQDGIIAPGSSVHDYGCGLGGDVARLRSTGFEASGWDPVHTPDDSEPTSADVVNLGYVVNVIEDREERDETLRQAWALARKRLVIAARMQDELADQSFAAHEDGCLTKMGTFQKFYTQSELRAWIDQTLGVASVAAAPGVFYVFRGGDERETFVASRHRRSATTPQRRRVDVLYETHQALLDELMEFIAGRGRIPQRAEFARFDEVVSACGSLKSAYRIIRRVTAEEEWDRIESERAQDLLVYLALTRFDRRPKFGQLPEPMQKDVRSWFSSYSRACELADALLFSLRDQPTLDRELRRSGVGKETPSALYVHVSAAPFLSPLVRLYLGCATAYLGAVEGANVIKLHRGEPRVSFLSYPTFEKEGHPALHWAVSLSLRTFRGDQIDFRSSENPPILHRKEEFVHSSHALHARFARLTAAEEKAGLFRDPSRIGTRRGWREELSRRRCQIKGHRLVLS